MNDPSNKRYWLRWTVACGIGEFLGIGVAAGLWFLHSVVFGEPQAIGQKILLIVVMIIAGVIEGLVTGAFQWSVLRIRFIDMKARNWLFFTALGAAVAWLLGMMPSTFFAPDAGVSSGGFEPSGGLVVLLGALMGVVLGALLGVFQWFELKKHTLAASCWILANALGWLAGMVVIFLGASLPAAGTSLAIIILIGAISGLFAGLLVGAITGLFLVRMGKTPVDK